MTHPSASFHTMHHRLAPSFILTSLFLVTALLPVSAKKWIMVAGTSTDGTSKGLYTFRFDDRTGKATPLSVLEVTNPTFVIRGQKTTTDRGHRLTLYAVTETSDSRAALHSIVLNTTDGSLKLLNSQPTHAADPCHIATNGRIVLTANYTGGSLDVFPLRADGTLAPMSQQLKGSAAPTDFPRNQGTPHVHCSRFTPDGRWVLASNFSANQLLRFAVRPDGTLAEAGVAATMSRNTAPRHFVFSDRCLYVIGEVSGAVSVFKRGEGEMQRIQEIQGDSVQGHGSADIHLSPDGRFLYTSHRLKADGISIFAVNPHDGKLRKIGYQLTGIHPRNFNITRNGRFLLCACRDSNKIQVFRIDRKTGMLTDTHQDISLDKPMCVELCR